MRSVVSGLAAVFGWALFAPLGCSSANAAVVVAVNVSAGETYCSGLLPVPANGALSAVAAATLFVVVFGVYTLSRRRSRRP
jgi:hypothetical protein